MTDILSQHDCPECGHANNVGAVAYNGAHVYCSEHGRVERETDWSEMPDYVKQYAEENL
jgi:hypothetical protein